MKKKLQFLFGGIFFVAAAVGLGALDERDYSRLQLQEGIGRFEQKEYGDAMDCFSKYQRLNPDSYEVAYWIGRVYEVERDYDLALLQYQKSLSALPEDSEADGNEKIPIALHLAEMYRLKGDSSRFLEILNRLLERGTLPTQKERRRQYQTLHRVLTEGGLNRVLELYRLQGSFEPLVYQRLADYYLAESDRQSAQELLLLKAVTDLSLYLNEVRRLDPSFVFTQSLNQHPGQANTHYFQSLSEVFKSYSRHYELQAFAAETQLMETLYQLAEGYHQFGEDSLAIDLLWVCIQYPYNEACAVASNRLFREIAGGEARPATPLPEATLPASSGAVSTPAP